ncbi:hypothetical protein CVT24_001034 [Panaeolus cyanescens]|uniref:Uncharacterized protein n=1 Tax=Panaeolus cyanescens TaxID=181874 RepID=A0A409YTJ3_9AGAR|nr:hypothetical protein CVT24_001034 [Panaeolus cyanescens]
MQGTRISCNFQQYPPLSTDEADQDLEVPTWILVAKWDKTSYQTIHNEVPQHCLINGYITLPTQTTTPPIPSSFSSSSHSVPNRTHRTRNRVHPYPKMQYQVAQAVGTENLTLSSPFVSSLSNAVEESLGRERQVSPPQDERWDAPLGALLPSPGPPPSRRPFPIPVLSGQVPGSPFSNTGTRSSGTPATSTTTTSSSPSKPWTPDPKGEKIMKLGPQEPQIQELKPTMMRHRVTDFNVHGPAKRARTTRKEEDEGQSKKRRL